jgi:NAD(P)H-flavin reductase
MSGHERRDLFPDLTKSPLRYTTGLAGVDQKGNYLWVNVLLICFMVLLFSVLGLQLAKMLLAQMRHMASVGNPNQQAFWAHNQTQWWPWLKQHVFYAPMFKNRHNKPFQLSTAVTNGTLPGRFHVLLLSVYVLSNIAYCLVLPWNHSEAKDGSALAAFRGRTGTLATLNLFPTILFALRNNPLIPILRVSYDDFNLMHRWCGRIVVVEALLHTIAWLVNCVKVQGWRYVALLLHTHESYAWGMVGSVLFTFIIFQASAPVRHAFYETFLNIHRLVVFFALIGVYVHLKKDKLPQLPWMNIIFTFWGLEWFFRLARIGYYNLSYRRGITRIRVEALPGNACRLTIHMVRPWTPRPGCYVHLYMPKLALWSSHPFSIAWSDIIPPPELPGPVTEKAPIRLPVPETSNTIHLVCRARTGFTLEMYRRAAASEGATFTTWGAVEGPYGGHEKLDSYGSVLLFAGGVGITHQAMYVRHLVALYSEGRIAAKRITLVWTIPDTECLEWMRVWMDQILALPKRKEILRIMIFVTRPNGARISSASDMVQMFPGRPKMQEIVDTEISNRVGAMCVQVCGSGGFSDMVRAATRKRVQVGVVDFIEEAFTY